MKLYNFLLIELLLLFSSIIGFLISDRITTPSTTCDLSYYNSQIYTEDLTLDIDNSNPYTNIEFGKFNLTMDWFYITLKINPQSRTSTEQLLLGVFSSPAFILGDTTLIAASFFEENVYFSLNSYQNEFQINSSQLNIDRGLRNEFYFWIIHGTDIINENESYYQLVQYQYKLDLSIRYQITYKKDMELYKTGENISTISTILIVALILIAIFSIGIKKDFKYWYYDYNRRFQSKMYDAQYWTLEKMITLYFSKNIGKKPPKEFYEVLAKLYNFWNYVNNNHGWEITKNFENEVKDFHPFIKNHLIEASKFRSYSEIKKGRGYIEFIYKKDILIEFKVNKDEFDSLNNLISKFQYQTDSELNASLCEFAFIVCLDIQDIGDDRISSIDNYFIPKIITGGYKIDSSNDRTPRGLVFIFIPGGKRSSHSKVKK